MQAVVFVGGGHGCGWAGLVEEVGGRWGLCRRCGAPLERPGRLVRCSAPGCVYERPVFRPHVELTAWHKGPDTHWMFDPETGRPHHETPQDGCCYCYPPDEPEPAMIPVSLW